MDIKPSKLFNHYWKINHHAITLFEQLDCANKIDKGSINFKEDWDLCLLAENVSRVLSEVNDFKNYTFGVCDMMEYCRYYKKKDYDVLITKHIKYIDEIDYYMDDIDLTTNSKEHNNKQYMIEFMVEYGMIKPNYEDLKKLMS